MASSSAALDVPFIEVICSYPTRETLCCECPALLFLVYEHVVAELQGGRRPYDPFLHTSRQDNISELLSAPSVSAIFQRLYPAPGSEANNGSTATKDTTAVVVAGKESPSNVFWSYVRTTLEAAWASPYDSRARSFLAQVHGQPHFHFTGPRDEAPPGSGYPLHPSSLERALTTSKRFLRTATTCALDGSTDALGGRQAELCAVLQLARLVPHTPAATTAAAAKEVTPEGLNFCMVSLQQRWWALMGAALERVLLLTRGDAATSSVTKPVLWQLLAVLAVLDTAQYVFAFPDKQRDPAGHHLLARLAEIGLAYPMISDERRCFVLSPDFLHALHWHATAPLSLTFTQQLTQSGGSGAGGGGGEVRREDADTIITETNFRLYAYTRDADLLNILNQFAELEEVVNASLYCYRVTRDSFAAAMRKGITATQVLRFLSLRAHPSMLKRYEEREDTRAAASSSSNAEGSHNNNSSRRGGRSAALVDAVATLVVPQSFCDQVRMWESECRRVVFEHGVALLRNVSAEQQAAVTQYLTDAGEADALVHVESGYMVVREEVFERLIAPLLS